MPIRYSTTLDMPMLYVALYSPEQSCIYRIAIPYNGLEAYGVSLLPAAIVSFVVASLIASVAGAQIRFFIDPAAAGDRQ